MIYERRTIVNRNQPARLEEAALHVHEESP